MATAAKRERPFARVRERRGMTLDQAAYRMRITPGYLRALELGRSPLCFGLAQQMARVYECGLMELRQREEGR